MTIWPPASGLDQAEHALWVGISLGMDVSVFISG